MFDLPMALPSHEELIRLETEERRGGRGALDVLYDAVDTALHEGHDAQEWPRLAKWSEDLHPGELSTQLIVGVLVTTLPVHTQPWRQTWAKRAAAVLEKREGCRAEALLRGLRTPGREE